MSVVDVLAQVDHPGDATAVVGRSGREARRTLTFAELDAAVSERAVTLHGVDAGRPAPLVLEPDVDGVIELLAHWRRGAIPVPLNPRLGDVERAEAVDRLAGAQLPAGTQVVLWTSGTSGRPRGVALSWANLRASVDASVERLDLSARDVWLASLSPAHVGGLVLLVRSLVVGGAMRAFGVLTPAAVSDALDGADGGSGPTKAPTHCSLVPTQLLRVLEYRGERPAPRGLACVLVGGAHASAGLVDRALDLGWPIALTYGATEMSSQIATAPPAAVHEKRGAVGRPMPGVELRIDGSGEVAVRGPGRALGYVGDPEAELASPDDWYATGDLGRVDDDGDLWITGRRIDRIVTGGVTVDAQEVEEALRSHPAVIDACVVGVPDEEWGERVGAWVEPVVGELDIDDLDRHLRARLTGAKLPRVWHVAGGIPRNANGKSDRTAVRGALGKL